MRNAAIAMLLDTVETMQPGSYVDPQFREIHPADLPALLGMSAKEAQLILGEALEVDLIRISPSGGVSLTDRGRQELAQVKVPLVPDLAHIGSGI